MSTVYLVPDLPGYDAIGFDCTISEGHAIVATPTSNPIETGAVISDHVHDEPETFACEVLTTNHPFRPTFFGDGAFALTRVETPFVGDALMVNAFTLGREADLVQEMLSRLEALQKERVTCSIITSAREYSSMFLASIGLPRGPRSIGAGRFSLSFVQLLTVSAATVPAPTPKEPRGAPSSPKGQQATTDLKTEVQNFLGLELKPGESIAKSLGAWGKKQAGL